MAERYRRRDDPSAYGEEYDDEAIMRAIAPPGTAPPPSTTPVVDSRLSTGIPNPRTEERNRNMATDGGGGGATAPAPTGTPSATGSPRDQIVSAYQTYLGRAPSEGEIASQMGRGYNLHQSIQNIQTSPEAEAYSRSRLASPTPQPGQTTTPPAADPTRPSTSTGAGGDNSGGAAGGYDYIPGGEEITWGDTSNLNGFNTNEWGAGGTEGYDENSYKNIFGKIATRYPSSPEGLRQLVNDPDFKRMFPRATLIDHPTDPKIKFEPGDPPVDVLASSGQRGWQWLPEGGGGGAAGGGSSSGGGYTQGVVQPTPVPSTVGQGDNLQTILDKLERMSRGEDPFVDDEILGGLGLRGKRS